jgi:thiol-disulfide isomerase/thioredoxin
MKGFEDMLRRAVTIRDYLDDIPDGDRIKYDTRASTYVPNIKALKELRKYSDLFIVVAIGASWCKDCVQHMPVLDMISEKTEILAMVLGGVKTDPLNPDRQWAVPPSPPEVDTLGITRIPTILVYTKGGVEVGRIIEHPKETPTLEEELLFIMDQAA